MQNHPVISVIMPVYNMAEYLDDALKSWTDQTLREVEIICVDDASSDNSYDILQKWARRDSRIFIYRFDINKSTWCARKLGIEKSKGEYIMFADADDTIMPEACDTLVQEMKTNPVDILQFGSQIINVNNLPEEWITSLNNYLKPYDGYLYERDILTACFRDKKYGFTLWNKIYSSALCKQAICKQEEAYLPKAQDALTYFIIAFFAKSFRGLPGTAFYQYHYGRGGGGNQYISIKQFERFCTMGMVVEKVHTFLEEENALNECGQMEEAIRQDLFGDCFSNWLYRIPIEDKGKGYDFMIKYWKPHDVVSAVAKYHNKTCYDLAKILHESNVLTTKKKTIKTIATYYHSIENGGIGRVLCELSEKWIALGYRVILITDSPAEQNDYDVPEEIERFVVPNFLSVFSSNYNERAKAIEDIIIANKVDAVVYHAWVSHLILWDEILIKSLGVAFITHCHGVFSYALMKPWFKYQDIIAPYILSDAVVVLSDTDAAFWRYFNNNVHVVMNPSTGDINKWNTSEKSLNDILWVARLSDEKRPYDALEIIKEVRESIPDAKLHILGDSKVSSYMSSFKEKITELQLEENVILYGFHKEVRSYYERASVLLITSKYEGYCLTLQEGLMAGLPVVMYELPYLTLVQGNKGITSVKQGDIHDAANEIIKLLSNEKKRLEQGESSRRFIEQKLKFDYEAAWQEIFGSLGDSHPKYYSENERVMMETLVMHLDAGYQHYRDIEPYLNRKIMKTAFALIKVKDSLAERGMLQTLKKAGDKIRIILRL